jgi:hypothetical protein
MLHADRSRSRFIQFATRVRHDKGLEAMELPAEGGDEMSLQLCVDDVWFDIVHDDSPGSLSSEGIFIRAVVCVLPSTEEGEELCASALRSNQHFARAAAGCLAVDLESAELIYMVVQSLAAVENSDFLNALSEVAGAVRQWRDQFVHLAH